MKVTEGMLERALQIITQILAVLERQSHSVEVSEQGRTSVLINGEHVFFGIEESVRKVVTQKPRVPNPTDRWDYDQIVTYEPSGKLVLVIQATTWGNFEQRAKWSDAKIQRVETLIPEFVAGLMRTAVVLRRQGRGTQAALRPTKKDEQRRRPNCARISRRRRKSWSSSTNGSTTGNALNGYDAL